MKEPLVTVIVVSYNHEKFLTENLDSIRNQNYRNLQLIIGDDSSKDDSVQIIESWLAKNNFTATTVFHKINTGFTTMLNECIALSDGEYIKVLAADDYLDQDYLKICVAKMQENNSEFAFTNAFCVDNDSNINAAKYFFIPPYSNLEEVTESLLKGNFISGATLICKRELYKKMGKFSKTTILEDCHLVLFAVSQKILPLYIDESLVYYRRHLGNMTHSGNSHFIEIENIKELLIFDKTGKFSEQINAKITKEIKFREKSLIRNLLPLYENYKGKNSKLLFKIKHDRRIIKLKKIYYFIQDFKLFEKKSNKSS